MEVELLGIVASGILSVIALGLSGWALVFQRSSANTAKAALIEARLAREASEESAAAAASSAESSGRSALASEEMLELERTRDMRPTIAWRLERPDANLLLLRNCGTEDASGVTVEVPKDANTVAVVRLVETGSVLPPEMTWEILYSVPYEETPPRWLMVTSNEHQEPIPVEVPTWP